MPGFGDRCPYTGLTRTQIDHLVRKQEWNHFDPPVESRILRIDGGESRRGTRLINYASLLEYLAKLPDTSARLLAARLVCGPGGGRRPSALRPAPFSRETAIGRSACPRAPALSGGRALVHDQCGLGL